MRKVRDVLECLFDKELSERETSRCVGISRPAVKEYRQRFEASGLAWPIPAEMDDAQLEQALYSSSQNQAARGAEIDFTSIHAEMSKKGATLRILHEEWLEQTEEPHHLSYPQFTRRYAAFRSSLRISLRQRHVNGEAVFVDYAGPTVTIHDIQHGTTQTAQIFIGVLGGSNYTYCEATWSQKSRDWIDSHVRMFEFFGGVPLVVVHDNLRSAVTRADRVSPLINETYMNLCRHYKTHPFAARSYKPKDKAKAEVAVQIVERWILFRLRKQKFFTLGELNGKIRELLDQLNRKPFQKMPGSRFINWLESEKAALQPVRLDRFEYADFGVVRAGLDYHVVLDQHAYSVPYQLRGAELKYRMTSLFVELFHKGKRIASHERRHELGETTTLAAHRPPAHNAVAEWTHEEALTWAGTVGMATQALLELQLGQINNYHFGYRRTQAMKSLYKTFGQKRLEEACRYALEYKVTETEGLRKILAGGLDQLLRDDRLGRDIEQDGPSGTTGKLAAHENLRGSEYYDRIITSEERENQE